MDRLLGYGLKFTDRFTHTHLGEVGRCGMMNGDIGARVHTR